MANGFTYCQYHIEHSIFKCKKQCKHCKVYYDPVKKKRVPRKIKKLKLND